MTATWALARATISTLRRQKLFIVPIVGLVLSLLALAGTMLLSNDTSIPARDAEVIAWTAGAAAAFAAGVYGIIVGSSLIAREISDGTLLMVAVRPVARWQIMAGRVLGATIFIVGALLASCAVYGVVAVATAGTTAPFEEPLEAALLSIGGVLLKQRTDSVFMWLHSTTDPQLAFPVVLPWAFYWDYEVKLGDEDLEAIGVENASQISIMCVVNVGADVRRGTINLFSPIVINNETRLAKQVINTADGYSTRDPLFKAAEQPTPVAMHEDESINVAILQAA